jgi:hypothetical protein
MIRKEPPMKKQLKKMSLSKETLRSLDARGLEKAAGGSYDNTNCTCNTGTYVCSNCRPCL